MSTAAAGAQTNEGSPNTGANTGSAGGAAGAAGAAAGAGAGAGATSDWSSGLNSELKEYATSKGFKDVPMVIDSYRNLEKLLGVPKERVVKLPEKADDVEGWKAVNKALGAGDKPEDYKIPMPEKGGDPEFAKFAQKMFMENGVPLKTAEKLVQAWGDYGTQSVAARQAEATAVFTKDKEGLAKEWGAAYEQNLNIADKAASEFGLTMDQVKSMEQAMGFSKLSKFFHAIGTKIGEDKFVESGGRPNFSGKLTPEQANAKIAALNQDPTWRKQYLSGDIQVREEMSRLMEFANPSIK